MAYIRDRERKPEKPADEDDDDPIFDQVPVRVTCQHCGMNIITFIEHEASWVTYAVSLFLLFVLNWAALCVVPVVYPLFKDVVHHCPRCLSILATRSRVVWPSFRQEVMSFRFGSCVVVLARKYVIMLIALVTIIGGIHTVRNSAATGTVVESWHRGESVPLTWEDFLKDCGFKSYLGNPIHVGVAFEENYKNKTVHWEGTVHHVEDAVSLLWLSQRGAVFVAMDPPQFPMKRDMVDLVLLYNGGDEVASKASRLPRGSRFRFEATMIEVGKRGAPHILALWEVEPFTSSSGGVVSSLGGQNGTQESGLG